MAYNCGNYNEGAEMDDNVMRAAVSSAGTGILALLIQQARAKLAARAQRVGRGLPEEFGRLLGRCWARAYRGYKRALRR